MAQKIKHDLRSKGWKVACGILHLRNHHWQQLTSDGSSQFVVALPANYFNCCKQIVRFLVSHSLTVLNVRQVEAIFESRGSGMFLN